MELNKNFDGSTKLCDWYKIVRQNLQKIETSLNSKCDHDDVNAILADKIDSSAETISGIEALKAAYDSVDSAAEAINVLANSKLGIKAVDGESVETIINSYTNTMIEATNVTDAPGGDVQGLLIIGTKTVLWFSSKGDIYRKYDSGTWLCIESSVKVSPNNGNMYYTHSFGTKTLYSNAETVIGEIDLPLEFKYLVCNSIVVPVNNNPSNPAVQEDFTQVGKSGNYIRWTLTGKHMILYGKNIGYSGASSQTYDNIMFF